MVTYLGSSPAVADHQFIVARCAHAWFTYLRIVLLSHLQYATQFQMVGDIASMLMYRDWTVRTRDGSSHIIIVWPNIKELYKLERKKNVIIN
jgi:hypothetical protein